MNKIITAVVACFLCLSLGALSACNTVKGAGQDISNGGQDIKRAAIDASR